MDRSWRRWIIRLGAAALIAGVAAAWPYRLLGGPASDQVARMQGELDRARATGRAQRVRIGELRREIDALKNQPGAIEDIARRDLGMIRPGELVLRFEPGDAPPGSEPPATAPAAPGAARGPGAVPRAPGAASGPRDPGEAPRAPGAASGPRDPGGAPRAPGAASGPRDPGAVPGAPSAPRDPAKSAAAARGPVAPGGSS